MLRVLGHAAIAVGAPLRDEQRHWISVDECAELFGVSRDAILAAARSGLLRWRRAGGLFGETSIVVEPAVLVGPTSQRIVAAAGSAAERHCPGP